MPMCFQLHGRQIKPVKGAESLPLQEFAIQQCLSHQDICLFAKSHQDTFLYMGILGPLRCGQDQLPGPVLPEHFISHH